MALPGKRASTSASSPSTDSARCAATTTTSSEPAGRARTYSISGPTATAALEISVQGVVVQTRSESPGWTGLACDPSCPSDPSTTGSLTYTDGSFTSLYPCATSCEERDVPHRGQ